MSIPGGYVDLEIRILHKQQDAQGKVAYRVELTLDHGQEFPPGLAALGGIGPYEPGAMPAAEYGEALFKALFADQGLKAAWDRIRGQSGLRRIRLRIDPEL